MDMIVGFLALYLGVNVATWVLLSMALAGVIVFAVGIISLAHILDTRFGGGSAKILWVLLGLGIIGVAALCQITVLLRPWP